jgi:Cu/Ag efflux protein CusF
MDLGLRVTAGLALGLLLWAGTASAQAKADCDAQGRAKAAQKVEGQVVKVDPALDKLTVRAADGTVHEFQASKDTLRDLKVGDKIEANLRLAPKCP